jgi:hypothetical protein
MKTSLSKLSAAVLCLFFLVIFACPGQTARKHDVIILRDSTKLEVIIQEVNENTVKYKKITDTGGPVFSVSKSEIASILYGNGETEHFTAQSQVYFDEAPVPPVTSSKPYTGKALPFYNLPIRTVQEWDSNQLRANYKFYLKKANTYKNVGSVGAFGGIILTGVGAILINSADKRSYGLHNGTFPEIEIAGVLFVTAGIGAGIPLTIIGFVKKKSYTKKALIVKDELRRRKQPLAVHWAPCFNPVNQSANLAVKISF